MTDAVVCEYGVVSFRTQEIYVKAHSDEIKLKYDSNECVLPKPTD